MTAAYSSHPDGQRPNILWIVAEDIGQDLSCYGNADVTTPHLDQLAAEGRLYNNAFATSSVCSPSRSALITGMYQTSIGAQHHRSHRHDGYRLPQDVRLVPQSLREAGYFCAGVTRFPEGTGIKASAKQDWNFTPPEDVWDSNEWADLKAQQPFFAMINMGEAHRPYRSSAGPAVDPDTLITLPPYVADHSLAREDWAAYLETVQSLDAKIGAILALLEEDGLRENTLVAFFGDHGREDFRGKASAFDGGYRVPLIVRRPYEQDGGARTDELVSLIDISASTLALAGVSAADVHGRPFLIEDTPPREFVFMARDRIEESVDHVRMVFDGRYRYIRNYLPNQPHFIERAYYDRTNPVRAVMRSLHAAGKLSPAQAKVFAAPRAEEELYDLQNDPYEFINLAMSPNQAAQAALAAMRTALDLWIAATQDQGGRPENPEAIDIGGGPGGKKNKGKGDKQRRQAGPGGRAAGARDAANESEPGSDAAPLIQGSGEPLVLAQTGILFVGGREVVSSGGGRRGGGTQTNIIEQSPVHFLIPHEREHETPVVMLPGHGLTSYIYLSTPDGRDGWAQTFARNGYAAYIMDQPNYGVSGFDLRPFEAVRGGRSDPETLPGMMRWSNEAAWRDWGIGPEPGVPFDDSKFPVAYLDQLLASYTTVISAARVGGKQDSAPEQRGRGDRFGAAAGAKALTALLDQIGPSILVVHSAAGAIGMEMLRRNPHLVAALVLLEPVGCPTDPQEIEAAFTDKPTIAVFGDHFDVRRMQGRYESCLETVRSIATAGGRAQMLHLPSQGIFGNTHLLMQDTNNQIIAQRVIDWLGAVS